MHIKNQKISARLKLQAILPVCQTAFEDWMRCTRCTSCKASILKPTGNEKMKVWVDAILFKQAIGNLLEISAQKSGESNELFLSIMKGWHSTCCIKIGYKRVNEIKDENNITLQADGESLEIISQHRGKIEFSNEKQHTNFIIEVPC